MRTRAPFGLWGAETSGPFGLHTAPALSIDVRMSACAGVTRHPRSSYTLLNVFMETVRANHATDVGTPSRQTGLQVECTAMIQSLAAFEAIRQKIEEDMKNFFGCALQSFANTVLK
jgi:uncharacterized protein YcgI (DUF1989 family)